MSDNLGPQGRKTVRSIELPEGHWDPDPAFHERAINRWQKERAQWQKERGQ